MTRRPSMRLEMFALEGIPEVQAGDDLGELIADAMARGAEPWTEGTVLAVAQKVVSKAEGRTRRLQDIVPGDEARAIAATSGKDARKVQAILDESTEIVRVSAAPPDGIVIARHRQGWVCANAGIDESNLGARHGELLLLPEDVDASAARIAERIARITGVRPGVVVTDTFGRPWRKGLVNVALGTSAVAPILDWVGSTDAYGRRLQVSQQAFADEIAAAAGLLTPKDAATPVVVIRHLRWQAQAEASARQYVRSPKEDLFR
ncbi:coenzyme F420-0:L-glutamate ligase [Pseudorhodoferax sp.]|uniref:coenzyme F420-0:L-glutamate ligase n=1 Tax=Pseudorhodoferax sp. TaxID=1993553 RepID=UPI002DD6AE7E|nr:coenzyme F420-0:L-glutamate ligase [Pseudorhodoferax sp.]